MKRYDGQVLDDNGRPVRNVDVTVRKFVGSELNPGEVGNGGSESGRGTGGAAGGAGAESGGNGGAWGQAGQSRTGASGGAGGYAVKLTNGATVTWMSGSASRVSGAVGA